MLLDVLSPLSQVSFNYKLAHIIGLEGAIYLSEAMNMYDNAIRQKATAMYNGLTYFTLPRQYVEERTTFSDVKQRLIEDSLSKVNLIYTIPDQDGVISIDIDAIISLVGGEVENRYLDRISEIVKQKSKEDNEKAKLGGIKKWANFCIKTQDAELRTAYENWIEALILRYNGSITKHMIYKAETDINNFTNGDRDLALQLVNQAAITGYNSMEWTINKYKELHPNYNKENKLEEKIVRTATLKGRKF